VTVDKTGADAPGPRDSGAVLTSTDRDPSQAALERYRQRMRRSRRRYFAVLAVVVLAVGITVGIVWSRGEAAHTTLHTAAHPAPSVALGTPSAVLTKAWQSGDRAAIGTPYWGGTVITYSHDSVRGRNGSTGALTWSYTRSDRTLCQVIQDHGLTVAVYELHGNCDQLTALDSATGARKWTRTLDKDHQLLNGHPAYSLNQYAILLRGAHVIYTIDPSTGLDRWVYQPANCTISGAVIGVQGALISQTCTRPKCAGLTFCGSGPQLLLRDANAGRSDDQKQKANPDQIKWNLIGTNAMPASADQLISAVDPLGRRLLVLDGSKGKTLARLELKRAVTSSAGVAATATDRAELVWFAGTTYAVAVTGAGLLWSSPTAGPVTATQSSGKVVSPPVLASSTLAAPSAAGIDLLEPSTGTPVRTVTGVNASAARVYPFGTGFVVAGASTAVYR
jgi:hypothetical protein